MKKINKIAYKVCMRSLNGNIELKMAVVFQMKFSGFVRKLYGHTKIGSNRTAYLVKL